MKRKRGEEKRNGKEKKRKKRKKKKPRNVWNLYGNYDFVWFVRIFGPFYGF